LISNHTLDAVFIYFDFWGCWRVVYFGSLGSRDFNSEGGKSPSLEAVGRQVGDESRQLPDTTIQ